MKRRSLLQGMALGILFPGAAIRAATQATVQVYLNPGCGCCGGWVEHLRANGFAVQVHEVDNPGQYRERFGMPEKYAACHSARMETYALEGHVPAREIKWLLREQPKAIGLAVADMPMGSPGMEGSRKEAYDVLLIDTSGGHTVYGQYAASIST